MYSVDYGALSFSICSFVNSCGSVCILFPGRMKNKRDMVTPISRFSFFNCAETEVDRKEERQTEGCKQAIPPEQPLN